MTQVTALHHITAISGEPQTTVDFYVGTLGLRLVKRSINQDVPDTYHLFFADGSGNPGTDITFFPWPSMAPGRVGQGVWGEVSFIIPPASLDFWHQRLQTAGVGQLTREQRFGEQVIAFTDPHGLRLSLTATQAHNGHSFTAWDASSVADSHQIRGLGSVRLTVRDATQTAAFLGSALGFVRAAQDGTWVRYTVGDGAGGQRIDVRTDPDAPVGSWGVGAVHHVAFRVADDAVEQQVRDQILDAGGIPSNVIDRFWFKSVYVREPSEALCEIATDGPGFAVDEDAQHLGESLVLPPWYEPQRAAIESVLPPIELPAEVQA